MANGNLNIDQAGETGENVLKLMKNQAVAEFLFKSSRKSITMATNFKPSSKLEEVFIDPNLLFQCLTAIGKNSKASLEHLFKFKLSPFTAPLAKSPITMHSPDKPKPVESLRKCSNPQNNVVNKGTQ